MMDNNLNDLDGLLKNRVVPEPSSNLAHRIVAASQRGEKVSSWSVFSERIASVFMIPKPALAFACFVLLGLAIVWPQSNTPSQGIGDYTTQEDFASVLEDDFIFDAFEISSL